MLIRLFILLAAGYGALCLLVFVLQRGMLYFPVRQDPETALQEAKHLNLALWKSDKGQILGWRSRHPSHRPTGTLLVLQGNAGSALDRTYLRDAFQHPQLPAALDIVLLEYPGYGPREGSPSEATLVAATVDAIDRLREESDRPIVLLGESLGSAVAVLAASQRSDQVKGLLLVTPLKNVPAIARRHYPLLPSFLARDTLRADRALAKLRLPVGFLIAGRDEVVFPDLGMELFEAYAGPKRLWRDERAGHNSIDYRPSLPRWAEMVTFVAPSGAASGSAN